MKSEIIPRGICESYKLTFIDTGFTRSFAYLRRTCVLQDVGEKKNSVRLFLSVYICVCVLHYSLCLLQAVYTDWNHYYQLQLGTTHYNIPHNNYCY